MDLKLSAFWLAVTFLFIFYFIIQLENVIVPLCHYSCSVDFPILIESEHLKLYRYSYRPWYERPFKIQLEEFGF